MKRWIHAQNDTVMSDTCVKGSEDYWDEEDDYYEEERFPNPLDKEAVDDFLTWYDSLSARMQNKVDDLADKMGLPFYEECTSGELSALHDSIVSSNSK